ncbi:polysaccharide pyruvyl transferase family protein [Clostridium folliculivorans]|uniref:polysaccharide pyruvyl transferase family protein n=1 Tax=Clostridium folliculivorans TaxID=2886038 RepID=UPI0021C4AC3E|nr:polysaccharide pyruvyl transferase family protein [Clostridium folliculivorans]GKU31644.1 hypothetical protein CFB3_37510 [Clostridium folliculivorans]
MKCVLISFFSSDNLGDLVISDTLYNFVKCKVNVKKLSYEGNPVEYSDINKMIYFRKVTKKQHIKQIKRKLINMCGLEKFADWYLKKNKRERDIIIEKEIIDSDLLIIGGGNMIFDVDKFSRSAKGFGKIIDVANKNNKKVFAISIGIGPFVTKEQELQAVFALNKCDFITFRDKKSLEIYRKHYSCDKKAFLTVDPVFLLSNHSTKIGYKSSTVIGVNLFNNKTARVNIKKYNEVLDGYVDLIHTLLNETDSKIVLFSTDLNDYSLIDEVYKKVSDPNVEVRMISGFDDLMQLYGQIKLLIGCRMHSMIMAYTQYIPVIGLSWQPKVDAFFDIIDEPQCVFKYDTIKNNLNEIIECYKIKLVNLDFEKEKIKVGLEKIRSEFRINEDIISKLIGEK